MSTPPLNIETNLVERLGKLPIDTHKKLLLDALDMHTKATITYTHVYQDANKALTYLIETLNNLADGSADPVKLKRTENFILAQIFYVKAVSEFTTYAHRLLDSSR